MIVLFLVVCGASKLITIVAIFVSISLAVNEGSSPPTSFPTLDTHFDWGEISQKESLFLLCHRIFLFYSE